MSTTPTALRSRYNVFIQDHEVAWELVMAALAVAFLVVGFASDEATGAESTARTIVELALTGVFAAEFLSRFLAAHYRRRYLQGHWIDVIALVPSVRGFRLLRLIRLLRLVRTFAGVYRALSSIEPLATALAP